MHDIRATRYHTSPIHCPASAQRKDTHLNLMNSAARRGAHFLQEKLR